MNQSAFQVNKETRWKREQGTTTLCSLALEEQLSIVEDLDAIDPAVFLRQLWDKGYQIALVCEKAGG